MAAHSLSWATVICWLMFATAPVIQSQLSYSDSYYNFYSNDYTYEEEPSTPDCGENLFAPSGGPVTSPNYPSNYGNNENCEWSITVPEGSIIRLMFDSFNIEHSYDFLTIYDGANDSAPQLQRLTGQQPVSPITSTSNMMFFRFTSDRSETRQGFQFSYISSTPGHCWDPGVSTNGYRDNNSNFTSGQTVRYSCMAGYQVWGNANITCRTNGTWSDATPTCKSNTKIFNNRSISTIGYGLASISLLNNWKNQSGLEE
ncbi:CUB and sushi domain-containing protein 2-like [Branchiostoma floridae]|uniref:CUB and sushi domain-containing protein 2-like n=1 Tax=Branchiostoma floridae TaxID=7739 RepID=A0A9J7HKQ1_BRAFL|nr:CUB and sushi domain-containing protein 2-like [Branchiostoma floridae]